MKTLLSNARKYCFLLLLLAPLLSNAQKSFEHQNDSLRRAFHRQDSLRKSMAPRDTIKNVLVKSPALVIYRVAKLVIPGNEQLSIQGVRFRHSHYLYLTLRGGFAKPVTVAAQRKLHLLTTDNREIILSSMGVGLSKSNGTRNSNNVKLAYGLPDDDFKLLLSKKVMAARIDYDGGEWRFDINNEGADNIRKAFLLTR